MTAKTEKVTPGIEQIPLEGIQALGRIFAEGQETIHKKSANT